MVFESVVTPRIAIERPITIVVLAALFVSLAIWIVGWLGLTGGESYLIIAFVALPTIPFLFRLVERTALSEEGRFLGSRTLRRYAPLIKVYGALFIGAMLAFAFWHALLPKAVSEVFFSAQLKELKAIKALIGEALAGYAMGDSLFELIFFNNLRVLLLILLFSIFYGAGSVFILIWNASIIGVFVGGVGKSFASLGVHEAISRSAIALAQILPHGTFEMLAYLTASLAGIVLSVAIAQRAWRSGRFILILHDIAKLIAWSILFLAFAALLETV